MEWILDGYPNLPCMGKSVRLAMIGPACIALVSAVCTRNDENSRGRRSVACEIRTHAVINLDLL